MMLRLAKGTVVWALVSLLLTGCWDIKNLQDINYLTAIGFDYENEEYVVYVQLLDFASVAKSESGKPAAAVPVWVGQGKGPTLIGAFNNLYRTSQMRIFYGQVNTIVFSENLMKKGLKDAKEIVNRYYELRYTPWVFGTKEPLDKVFAVTPFFNLSPITSLLHQPMESYRQLSLIAPIKVREFTSLYREPGSSVLVPSLAITDQSWEADGKPKPMLEVDGCYSFQNSQYRGWLEVKKVFGLRWVQRQTNRSPLLIEKDGKPQVAISLERPRSKIHPRFQDGKVTYSLDVKLDGYISEVLDSIPEQELQRRAEEKVRQEIQRTYDEGLKIGADLIGLEHVLYRKHNRKWKQLNNQDAAKVNSSSLRQIEVKIHLKHSGKLKY